MAAFWARLSTCGVLKKAHPSQWDWTGLETDILTQFGVKIRQEELKDLDRRQMEEAINDQLLKKYQEKEAMVGPELMRETERMIMLNVIDNQWKDHLLSMDHLKEGIGLRGYGQKDPLVEYKKESYVLFQDMMDRIEDETIRWLFFMQRSEDAGRRRCRIPRFGRRKRTKSSKNGNGDGGEPEAVAVAAAHEQDSWSNGRPRRIRCST